MITIDEVIQKAKLVGVDVSNNRSSEVWAVDLLEFVKQFVINERKACAKLFADEDCLFEGKHIAAAIRSRSSEH